MELILISRFDTLTRQAYIKKLNKTHIKKQWSTNNVCIILVITEVIINNNYIFLQIFKSGYMKKRLYAQNHSNVTQANCLTSNGNDPEDSEMRKV